MTDKTLTLADARHLATGEPVRGYEIHIGRTDGADRARPCLILADGRAEGAESADGRIAGCYLHGLFTADGFRRAFLRQIGGLGEASLGFEAMVESTLDRLADHLDAHLDADALLSAARPLALTGASTPVAGPAP